MQKKLLVTAGSFGLLGVVLGAMGAHFLKEHLDATRLESFNTGVKFMFYHALALLAFGIIAEKKTDKLFNWAVQLIVWGTILFSGSIYFLSTQTLMGISLPKIVGLVTPIGGLLLSAGWLLFILSFLKKQKN